MADSFAQALKEIRRAKHWSQEVLAQKLGTSKQVISRYERGERIPKISIAIKYAEILGVSLKELIGSEAAPTPTAPEAPAPGSAASGWNVEYPSGVALHTARDPRPGEVASGLSETDIFRIAQKVKNLNDRSLPYANLNPSEAQLVENYRLLYPRQRLKVDSYIAKLLDGNEKE